MVLLSTLLMRARTFTIPPCLPLLYKTIMNAKQIVLVANGKNKAKAIKDALEGEVTPWCQASVLQLRKNVVFVLDEDAASELTEYKPL